MFSVGDLVVHPMHGAGVIDAIEREADKGLLLDEIIRSVSNHELLLSKVFVAPTPEDVKDAFEAAQNFAKK